MKTTYLERERFNQTVAELVWTYIVIGLTPMQRRIITYVIMQTEVPKTNSKEFAPVISTKDYLANSLNILGQNGKFRKTIREEIKKMTLFETVVNVENQEVHFSLLDDVEYNNKKVAFRLSSSLLPYYSNIKKIYNEQHLQYFIFSKTKNAPMLYLLLQRNTMAEMMSCSVKQIKHCLYIDSDVYARDYDFYNRFIVPAVKDMNRYSFYFVECDYVKGGVCFRVRSKSPQELMMLTDIAKEQFYNGRCVGIERSL